MRCGSTLGGRGSDRDSSGWDGMLEGCSFKEDSGPLSGAGQVADQKTKSTREQQEAPRCGLNVPVTGV